MAEKLCNLRKYGGGNSLKETVLWTNSNPGTQFAAQTVTLSHSLLDFDYIKIKYRAVYDNADYGAAEIMSITDFMSLENTARRCSGMGISVMIGTIQYSRRAKASGNNGVYFTGAIAINQSGSNNGLGVPEEIYGMK